MDDTVKLWLRVGMTLEVSPEVKKELQAGNKYILQDVLNGKIGRAYLDGETYFPDVSQNAGLQEMEFDFSGLQLSVDYKKAVEHFNREVYGKREKGLTIDGDFVQKHASELIFCHQNAKDMLDFDMWTHYEELLGEPISFDEYSAIDKQFDGDILDYDKADTQTVIELRNNLALLRGDAEAEKAELEDLKIINIVRADEHKIQTASFDSLKKGDMVFGYNGDICIIAEDYNPDMTKNHNGRIQDTNGTWWRPGELERDLQGDIFKAPCTLFKGKADKVDGTVLVNTYTGDIYNPDFPGHTLDEVDSKGYSDGLIHINGVDAPFYRYGNNRMCCFPSDLKPRPSLDDILSNASIRSSGTHADKTATSKDPER